MYISKSQAVAFFEEISKNSKLAKEVEKVVGVKNSDEAKAKELISLAKKYNFNFTQKEVASAQGSLKKSLSPEEMLEVSGGKGGLKSSIMAMALLAGLGVALSSTEASAMEGGQQQEIQVPDGQAPAEQAVGGNQAQPAQQEGADPAAQQQVNSGNHAHPWYYAGLTAVPAAHYLDVVGAGGIRAVDAGGLVQVNGDRPVAVNNAGFCDVTVNGDRPVFVNGASGRPVLVDGDRLVYVTGAGEQPVIVDADREVRVAVACEEVACVNGDRQVQVTGATRVLIGRPDTADAGLTADIVVTRAQQLTPEQIQQMNPARDPQQPLWLPRDVQVNDGGTITINKANGVTVAPGISTHIQNGTAFTMGATREETVNNILDTMPEPNLSEQNTTTLTDQLRAIVRDYGLSGESLFAFLRKHVFRGG